MYIEKDIVLLPVEKIEGKMYSSMIAKYKGKLYKYHSPHYVYEKATFYNIHCLSDENIKEGDLYMVTDFTKPEDIRVATKETENKCRRHNGYKKLIATSDSNLVTGNKIMPDGKVFDPDGIHENWDYMFDVKSGFGLQRIQRDEQIPQISKDFIEYFIKEYNCGNIINKVNIEYELIDKPVHDYPLNKVKQIKVNNNNEINIELIKPKLSEEQKSYVEKMCRLAYGAGQANILGQDKWVKENL